MSQLPQTWTLLFIDIYRIIHLLQGVQDMGKTEEKTNLLITACGHCRYDASIDQIPERRKAFGEG